MNSHPMSKKHVLLECPAQSQTVRKSAVVAAQLLKTMKTLISAGDICTAVNNIS